MRLATLAALLALAGCVAPPAALPPPGPDPAVLAAAQARADSLAQIEAARVAERRAEAERLAAERAATAARQAAITAASRARTTLTLERPTVVRDEPSLGAAIVAELPAGTRVTVLSHDGRYWGVQTGESKWGYIHADAMPRDENARVLVTTGRDVAAERASERAAVEAREREAAAAREARRAAAPPPRASSGRSSGRSRPSAAPRSTSTRCTGITQRGSRCLRMTTNRSGRCWQH